MPRKPTFAFLLAHPAHFFALGCGSGLAPKAPGTFGTLFAWLSFALFRPYFEELPLLGLLLAAYLAGIGFIDVTGKALGDPYHGSIGWAERLPFCLGLTDLMFMSQGSMMGSVPLALERRFARVLIPASVDLDWKESWGTHPITDGLLSTVGTVVADDGLAAPRIEKTAFVARSDVALAALRVCLFTGDETNCMRYG